MKTSASPAAIEAAQAQVTDTSIASDRLVGAEQIGRFIDPAMTPRQARRLLEAKLYPHWREGKVFVASKRALTEHWRKMTGGTSEVSA